MTTPPTPEELQAIMADSHKLRQFFCGMPEEFWLGAGQKYATDTFSTAVKAVPAYQDFLRTAGVSPEAVTPASFSELPPMTKENYFHRYPLPQTVVGGEVSRAYWIATSSGTTGKPQYWPRLPEQDALNRVTGELMLSFFDFEQKSTLYIVGLFMGTWFGATYSGDTAMQIGRRPDTRLTVITPGANSAQILDIIEDLGRYYDQVVISAYPPTARTVLLEGEARGIDWKQYSPKLILGGEPVSNEWKEFALSRMGSDNPDDILVTFAMSEVGMLAFETPLAGLIRRLVHRDKELGRRLFGGASVAALTQYPPLLRWLEIDKDGELVITAGGAAPLVRYKSHDLGGILHYGEMRKKLAEAGYNLETEFEKTGHRREDIWKWPFFYSLGRSNAIALLGAKIYPENLEPYIYRHPEIADFKIHLAHSESQRPEFRVYLELQPGIRMDHARLQEFTAQGAQELHELLLSCNEDYEDAFQEEGDAVRPHLIVQEHETGVFADGRVKQRHVLDYDA